LIALIGICEKSTGVVISDALIINSGAKIIYTEKIINNELDIKIKLLTDFVRGRNDLAVKIANAGQKTAEAT